jgi:hypothetical protein
MTDASVAAAIAAHKDWKELVLAKCPLQLWKAIQVTHRAGVSGHDETRKSLLLERWHELRQHDHESVFLYRARFQHIVNTMKEMGLAVQEDKSLAITFIQLNPRFNEYMQELDHFVQQYRQGSKHYRRSFYKDHQFKIWRNGVRITLSEQAPRPKEEFAHVRSSNSHCSR